MGAETQKDYVSLYMVALKIKCVTIRAHSMPAKCTWADGTRVRLNCCDTIGTEGFS